MEGQTTHTPEDSISMITELFRSHFKTVLKLVFFLGFTACATPDHSPDPDFRDPTDTVIDDRYVQHEEFLPSQEEFGWEPMELDEAKEDQTLTILPTRYFFSLAGR